MPIDLVLAGGGHSNVFVLEAFASEPIPGVRLTLVAKELSAPYSGMLPGYVAGYYQRDACHIDLVRLAAAANARVIHGAVTSVDAEQRRITVSGAEQLTYDFLSIDVGVTPLLDDIEGARAFAIAVKPVSDFADKWERLLADALSGGGPRSLSVVGGGAAGVELVLAMRQRLIAAAPGAGIDPSGFNFKLIAGKDVLPSHGWLAKALAKKALKAAAIEVSVFDPARAITAKSIALQSGKTIKSDAALISTRAAPHAWFASSGLPCSLDGFLRARPTLQLIGDDRIFATGDCAGIDGSRREKAGVFAVRQGPVLARNLRNAISGNRLETHRPQRLSLSLISLGEKSAIASYGPIAASGAWAWRWKDSIDRAFVARFNPARD